MKQKNGQQNIINDDCKENETSNDELIND